MTREALERAASCRLGQYSSSSENLRRVLFRRVVRSGKHHGTNVSEGQNWIKEIVDKLIEDEILNDIRYAQTKCISLYNKGASKLKIRIFLKEREF